MKFLKYMTVLSLAFSFASFAQAQTASLPASVSAPVAGNVSGTVVLPNNSARVEYNFDPFLQTLNCIDSNHVVGGYAIWVYKNQYWFSGFPVILKASASFDGNWADARGHMFIDNRSGQPMYVSCEYQNMQ